MKRQLLYWAYLCVLFLSSISASAQAPNISYSSSTNVYPLNTTITSLTPTNTGGTVPATIYGQVTTVAGGNVGYKNNNNALSAKFNSPTSIVADASGNFYIADYSNNAIREINTAGVVSTFAGSTASGNTGAYTDNSVGTSARFNGPDGIAIDGAGNLYIADFNNNAIRKITSAGAVTTFASGVNGPAGLCFDGSGNLYVAARSGNVINKITSGGTMSTYAGSTVGIAGYVDSPTALSAQFNQPTDVQADASGNIFVVDYMNNVIRKITPAGAVTTFAGSLSGTAGYLNGTGTAAQFSNPARITMDAVGNFYIADYLNNDIREITPAGVVTLLAGSTSQSSGNTDGTTTGALFNGPSDMYIDGTGIMYLADLNNNHIRKIYLTGYAISPALPAGLSFDGTTGIISGTPTAISAATNYTIIAYNVSGSCSTVANIACERTVDWKGGTSTDWNTGSNWSILTVPTVTDAVRIGVVAYTIATNEPSITSADVTLNSITFGTVHPAGVLTVGTGRALTVNNNLTVNSPATPTLTGAGEVDIAPGAIVNIPGTGVLKITLTGKFTLQSNATGSASIGQITTSSITGTVYVERYLTGGSLTYRGYRLLSSPVHSGVSSNYSINYLINSIFLTGTKTNATGGFDNIVPANPTLYLFRENITPAYSTFLNSNFRGINNILTGPTYGMDDITYPTTSIPVGNGFLCFFRGSRTTVSPFVSTTIPNAATLTASGTINAGQIAINDWFTGAGLSFTSASPAAIKGYNLVGNPYASSIDWDTFQTAGPGTTGIYGVNIGTSVYMLNPANHNYGVYTAGGGGIGTNGATNIIASGQGFFVKATNSSPALTFNESAKTFSQVTSTNLLMGVPADITNTQLLRLQLAKDSVNTEDILIHFNSQASMAYDGRVDATYKPGYGAVSLNGISSDNVYMAIKAIPLPKQSETIGLGVNATTNGIYKLNLENIVGIPQLFDIWLMDAYKKDSLDLRHNKTYSFNILKSDTNSFGSKRFTLVFRQNMAYAYRLLDFTAVKVAPTVPTGIGAVTQVQVTWKTENEQNYTNFTVERSSDNGKTFKVLGGMASSAQRTYSFLDKSPANGQNFYRLKQEDINNNITYSKVVTVLYSDLSNKIIVKNLSVYPNPVSNTINLAIASQTNESISYNIKFMNSSGIIVKEVTTPQSSWQGSISFLHAGVYVIRVVDNKNDNLIGETKFVKL